MPPRPAHRKPTSKHFHQSSSQDYHFWRVFSTIYSQNSFETYSSVYFFIAYFDRKPFVWKEPRVWSFSQWLWNKSGLSGSNLFWAKQISFISLKLNFSQTNLTYLAQIKFHQNKSRLSRSNSVSAKQISLISLKFSFSQTNPTYLLF